MKRFICSVCGYVESQTVEAGGHMDPKREGAKEPTFEEDGSTGALVCSKCGATIEEAKVISKLVNAAAGATVTVAHSRTKDLASFTKQADVLVSAVGKPNLITADMEVIPSIIEELINLSASFVGISFPFFSGLRHYRSHTSIT